MSSEDETRTKILNTWLRAFEDCGIEPATASDVTVTLRRKAAPPAPALETARPPSDASPVTASAPPDLGEDYEWLEEIGAGGQGVVWSAVQHSLTRRVAIKTMFESSPHALEIFTSEARVTAALDHPNIVPIYALGEREGELFLAMKKIEGEPWSTLLRDDPPASGPDALRRHLEVFRDVVDAVAFAHDRGFIHRDLKPENVMVGAFGQVYVLDWGLALDVSAGSDAGSRGAPTPDMSPGPAGTPAYMAPETAKNERPTSATDVYLLGGLLFHMLYGEPPHKGKSVLNALVRALRNDVFPLADVEGVPHPLVEVATRCLQTRAEDRYRNAGELREAVEQLMSGEAKREESAQRCREAEERMLALLGKAPAEQYGGLLEVEGLVLAAQQSWPGNPEALSLGRRAGEALVRSALAVHDFTLAASFLRRVETLGGESRGLRAEVERQRRFADPELLKEFDRERQRLRISAASTVILGVYMVIVLAAMQGLVPTIDFKNVWTTYSAFAFLIPASLLQGGQLRVTRNLAPGKLPLYWASQGLSAASVLVCLAVCAGTFAYSYPNYPNWPWSFVYLVPAVIWGEGFRRLSSARIRSLFPAQEESVSASSSSK